MIDNLNKEQILYLLKMQLKAQKNLSTTKLTPQDEVLAQQNIIFLRSLIDKIDFIMVDKKSYNAVVKCIKDLQPVYDKYHDEILK